MNSTKMSSRTNGGEYPSWHNNNTVPSSYETSHRRQMLEDVDFPNVKLDRVTLKEEERMTAAMTTLEKAIKVLEKQMIAAGQEGDFKKATSKETKRRDLLQKKTSLSDMGSLHSRSSAGSIDPHLLDDNSSRESLLQSIEEEFGLLEKKKKTKNRNKPPSDAMSMASVPSHPRRTARGTTKTSPTSSTSSSSSENIVSLVNSVLTTAPDSIKEDFAKGVVYKRTNDDRLNTIYEFEKQNTTSPKEEDCIKVQNVETVDPYGDKGRYTGMVVKRTGVPHGLGRFWYFQDKRTYEGEWNYGKWHGFGRSTCANGDVYEGEYRKDERHGVGTYTWNSTVSSGNKKKEYKGDFSHDRRHGRGIMVWPNGTTYQGGFVMGKMEGQGKMIYPKMENSQEEQAQVVVGTWIRGELIQDNAPQQQPPEPVSPLPAHVSPPAVATANNNSNDSNSLSSWNESCSKFASKPRASSFSSELSSSIHSSSQNHAERQEEWICGMCTYVNSDPLHLSCAVCGYARTCKRPFQDEGQ